ncbi:HEPN domain-containing protein [Thermostichus sp. OS-CIW-38]
MRKKLARDYYQRANYRIQALSFFYEVGDYADVVRMCQEIIELFIKACPIIKGINYGKTHDPGGQVAENRERFPELSDEEIALLENISFEMRKDRELAFYGAVDIVPLEYYKQKNADKAIAYVNQIKSIVEKYFNSDAELEGSPGNTTCECE